MYTGLTGTAVRSLAAVDQLLVATAVTAPQSGRESPLLAVGLALVFASVHVFAGRLRFLDTVPRSRILSFASGVTVAYVFVHVLPELEHAGTTMTDHPQAALLDHFVYVLVLAGFVAYYGLDRYVRECGVSEREGGECASPEKQSGVFWVHIGSFALYNTLIGYLLFHREAPGVGGLWPFAIAMGLHFVVNDYGLREHHTDVYHQRGRWVLALGVLVGAAFGTVVRFDEPLLGMFFAFLAGGIILNVIKEELPSAHESRFWPFALGTGIYAAMLAVL